MLLRLPVFISASLLMALLIGCSSGIQDQANDKTAKTSERSSGGSATATGTTGEVRRTPRGDGTADIAARQEAELTKQEAEKKAQDAEARRSVSRSGKPPAADDTLLFYYPSDPDSINPITSNDNVSNDFQRWVYEALADVDMGDPDNFKPALAERWEFDEKNLEYTIHLREKVKWHPMRLPNGELLPAKELTSKDVKFSFDCILNKNIEAGALRSYYEDPEATGDAPKYKIKVTVINEYTVKIKWSKPYFKIKEFTLGIPIFPRHVYSVDKEGRPISFDIGSKEFADGFNNHWANGQMCGTGPMMFKTWNKNERLELVRNPDYWDSPFYFSRVIFRNIPNPNTPVELALQNDLDWAKVREKDRFLQIKETESVKKGKVKLADYLDPGYRYIGYNQRRGEFLKEKQVRMALSHSVPVDTIIREVFKGFAQRTTGPFLVGSKIYDSSLPLIPFDLEKAKSLLEQAGWKDTDNDGIRDKLIKNVKVPAKFELVTYSNSPSFLTIAEIFKENCRKIGVDMQITNAQWSLFLQKVRKKEFDACMLGWGTPWRQDPFQLWHGSQAELADTSNSVGYQNPEVDKLIEQLRVTLDEDKQIPIYHRIHKLIYEDQPYTFLFSEQATAVYDSRLENIKFYKVTPGIDPGEWYSTSPRLQNAR